MKYLNDYPIPVLHDFDPTVKSGEVGILECGNDFLVVHYMSDETYGERITYKMIAKCADKALAKEICNAANQVLNDEAEKKRFGQHEEHEEWKDSFGSGAAFIADPDEVERARIKEPWKDSCAMVEDSKFLDNESEVCLQDDCPHTGSCPYFKP